MRVVLRGRVRSTKTLAKEVIIILDSQASLQEDIL